MSAFEAAGAARALVDERCTLAFPAIDALWVAILDELDGRGPAELWLVAVDGSPELLKSTAERTPRRRRSRCTARPRPRGVITLGQLDDTPELRLTSVGRPFTG